jgi:hypothetical protein
LKKLDFVHFAEKLRNFVSLSFLSNSVRILSCPDPDPPGLKFWIRPVQDPYLQHLYILLVILIVMPLTLLIFQS